MALQPSQTSDAVANALLSAFVTQAGANAQFRLYAGSKPATPTTAPAGALLVTIPGAAALGTVANRTLTIPATAQVAAAAAGTPGFWRIATSGGVGLVDLVVGTDITMTMESPTVQIGNKVSVTDLSFSI